MLRTGTRATLCWRGICCHRLSTVRPPQVGTAKLTITISRIDAAKAKATEIIIPWGCRASIITFDG